VRSPILAPDRRSLHQGFVKVHEKSGDISTQKTQQTTRDRLESLAFNFLGGSSCS